jgi:hypothetical protein
MIVLHSSEGLKEKAQSWGIEPEILGGFRTPSAEVA